MQLDKQSKLKRDAAFIVRNEEVYATKFGVGRQYRPTYRWRGGRFSNGRGSWRGFRSAASNYRSGNQGYQTHSNANKTRPINPTGPDGNALTCLACGSYRHMMDKCPHSWENMGEVNIVDSFQENVVLFTGYNKQDMATLGSEARNCAVLDSACSSTVCGINWYKGFKDTLSDEQKAKVVEKPGFKIFKFGGGEKLQSLSSCEIPATLAGKPVTIHTDVVDSDIPLLLSIDSMKRAKIKLDLENDTAEVLGENIALNYTSSGHYCVPIDNANSVAVEHVCAVKLHELNTSDLRNALLKLHRQFAHPPQVKLISLLKDAGAWREEFGAVISDISEKCDLCKRFAKTPARPIVALPMASRFNEKVAMDLKQWGDKWILHMVDLFSRFTVSVFIKRKLPCEIVDKIMTHWNRGRLRCNGRFAYR